MHEYQEYPKCLYRIVKGKNTAAATTVVDAKEEKAAKADGWQTAAEFHGYDAPAAKSKQGKKDDDE